MGWNSWNCFEKEIDEKKIRAIADAMVRSGMREAGYEYLVLDEGAIPPFDRKPSETSVFFGIRGFCGQIGGNWSHEKEAFSARIRKFEWQHKQVFRKGRLNARS
jgi:hypothetical protein